ncbi:hypothetical protein JCM10213_006415 [Rhodosporidiobolus nylandii]
MALSPSLIFAAHSRTASEVDLAALSLEDPVVGSARFDDEDLLDSLEPLGQSVVEEAEANFHDLAHQALAFAATPASSPLLAPSPAPVARSRRPSPSAHDYADPSYFALSRRNLYADGGDARWSRRASRCFSASSTPSLVEDTGSDFTPSVESTPAHSPILSYGDAFAAAYPSQSPDLFIPSLDAAPLATSSSGKPGIASRRPKATTADLRLDSFRTLRPSKSFSFASPSSLAPSPAADARCVSASTSPSTSPARTRKPRWMREMEDIAGLSSLAAAAAVEEINLSRSRVRSAEGSPVRLKQRRADHGFAF